MSELADAIRDAEATCREVHDRFVRRPPVDIMSLSLANLVRNVVEPEALPRMQRLGSLVALSRIGDQLQPRDDLEERLRLDCVRVEAAWRGMSPSREARSAETDR